MDKNRLRWAIRRGMLELDLVLEKFVNLYYDDLSVQQQLQFDKLLSCEDTQLQQWLLHGQKAGQNFVEFNSIVNQVRTSLNLKNI